MEVSDEMKRWIVVGIAMNKVVAPVLRNSIKQGMDANYTNLDIHCSGLATPCTLKTLTYHLVQTDRIILKNLKFQNVNNNHAHGTNRSLYIYNINSSIDLAKLYLPDYLAQFSAFDDSLDITAILRLLGYNNYKPVPIFCPDIQTSADDVRKNVRNKWGHFDVNEWTEAFFKDCFDKLEKLVKSLGLNAGDKKNILDQLADWQTKGCQLCMGHAVDKDLLHLVQQEVKDLIKDYNNIKSKLIEHDERFDAMEEMLQEASQNRSEEIRIILKRLESFEKIIISRVQAVEDGLTKTDDKVEQLEQRVDELELKQEMKSQRMQDVKPGKSLKLEELLDTSMVCREKRHENELLKLYCTQCKVCICDKCGETRHNHHTKVDIHKAAQQHKVDIVDVVEEMKKGIADYQEDVDRANELSRKSREKIATARNKIMTSFEELLRRLKEHETTTLTCLDIIEEEEQRSHAAQLEHFQTYITQLQTSVESCEAILERNQEIEILQARQSLTERCRRLLNTGKLNSYKPLHVTYAINEDVVEDVKSMFPAVGRVVVINTDPLQSVAEGTGLQEADVGSESTLKITTRDSHGNQCYNEDDNIVVKVQTPSGEELNHSIAPSEDGEYRVTYTPDCIGQHDVVIQVNGQPLTGSPWRVRVAPKTYKSVFTFGSRGTAQGQFNWPCDIAISDITGNIAVADYDNDVVKLFTLERTYLKDIGANKLTKPTSVAFTRTNEILIVAASGKIFCFNEGGKFLKNVSNQHLKSPNSLSIARDGRMVVCDSGDYTVKVLSSDGEQLLLTISAPDRARPYFAISHKSMFVVSYPWTRNVKVFNQDGVFLKTIGARGSGDEQLNFPIGLAIDRFNNLLVCDRYDSRLQMFTLDGMFVSTIEGQHTGLQSPWSVAVSSTGQLFVTDIGKPCLHVFQ